MQNHRDLSRRMLTLEAAGFLAIVAIIWLDESFDLPRLLFGAAPTPLRPIEGLLESFLTLAVAAVIVAITGTGLPAYRIPGVSDRDVRMVPRVRSSGEWLMVEGISRTAAPIENHSRHLRELRRSGCLPFPSSGAST